MSHDLHCKAVQCSEHSERSSEKNDGHCNFPWRTSLDLNAETPSKVNGFSSNCERLVVIECRRPNQSVFALRFNNLRSIVYMPVHAHCPACGEPLRAKDELAGEVSTCPSCSAAVQIPELDTREAHFDKASRQQGEDLLRCLIDDKFAEAAPLIRSLDLWLIDAAEEEEEEIAPLCAEVDGYETIVCFTSLEDSQRFAEENPALLDENEELPLFAVTGKDLLENLPSEMGLVINPESEDSIMLDNGCAADILQHIQATDDNAQVKIDVPTEQQRNEDGDPAAVELRRNNLDSLKQLGFSPAEWLPLPELNRDLRNDSEIKGRLFALASLFAWASAPPDALSDELLRNFVESNDLHQHFASEEPEIWAMDRTAALEEHSGSIGWKLENMWALAWVLGFEKDPSLHTGQIQQDIIQDLFFGFVGGLEEPMSALEPKNPRLPSSYRDGGCLLLRPQRSSQRPNRSRCEFSP